MRKPLVHIIDRIKGIKRTQRIRYATMALGILALAPPVGFIAQSFGGASICGSLCPRMAIGPSFMRELFTRTAGVALLFLWIGSTLFFGRWICSHVCPVGALTEFGSKAIPRRFKINYPRIFNAPLFRYGFLGAFILLPTFGYASICCGYCSFSAIPDLFGAIFSPGTRALSVFGTRLISIGLFGVLLGVLAVDGRGHCHLTCPIGALDTISNALGAKMPFARRVRIHLDKCTACGLCARECPTVAIEVDRAAEAKTKIDYQHCNHCRLCESICPTGAIQYSTLNAMKKEKSANVVELVHSPDAR